MKKHLLTRLALSGVQNNKKTVFPYILVSAITVMLFQILRAMIYSKYIINNGVPVFYGADYIVLFLHIGSMAVAFFSAIFLFYGNQFVMKTRRKEIGLYGILGLSKRHVSVILLIESLLEAVASIGMGLCAGVFMDKLMVLLLYKLTHQAPVKGFEFSGQAAIETIVLFTDIYAICLLYNLFSIRVGSPIALLKSENMGEKEPKVKGVLLVVGIICLVIGYKTALSANSTFGAMEKLMSSIALVMVATYALFVAGSILVLKLLKRNKGYYYKTRNFVSVSNLLFRMKHNAVGLASICILSTGVILLMVCSGSLMALGEQNINSMFKEDVMIRINEDDSMTEDLRLAAVDKAISESGIQSEDVLYREFYTTMCPAEVNNLKPLEDINALRDFSNFRDIYLLKLEDYNRYFGKNEKLGANEVLRYSSIDKVKAGDSVSIFGKDYVAKEVVKSKDLENIYDPTMTLFGKEIIVVADENVLTQLVGGSGEDGIGIKCIYIGFNSSETITNSQMADFRKVIGNEISSEDMTVKFKSEERSTFYSLLGGAFFVGIFLAVLFLIETVMIIYYKQMSEGYEDQRRFKILSNAGLTESEVKQTINNQVRLIFFLPVGTAIIHMLVASKILRLFMSSLVIVDTLTFFMATLAVCAVFVVVYVMVYKITSKQYYNIVYGVNA